jgi:hypothetical protein
VLSEEKSGDDTKKMKIVETLNHFLYELERSPFGVLGEATTFLRSKSESVAIYC